MRQVIKACMCVYVRVCVGVCVCVCVCVGTFSLCVRAAAQCANSTWSNRWCVPGNHLPRARVSFFMWRVRVPYLCTHVRAFVHARAPVYVRARVCVQRRAYLPTIIVLTRIEVRG